jgi:gliding motility-associated-like protein
MPDGVDCEEIVNPEPCDTVYIETIDTIYIDNFITDTLYIDNFIIDTLYVDVIDTLYIEVEVYITDTLYITEIEYVTDTLFITTVDTVEVIIYEFLTDTIYEYITIDCETGLECIDYPGIDCPDWTSVYIPNTFTPNNDGLNDTWQMVYDLDCWVDVEFKVFNRWGNEIYHSYGNYFDSYPYWDGSINGGNSYAIDGVYTYTFYAKKSNSVEVFQRHGHITIFR